jgi:hypothetical protein
MHKPLNREFDRIPSGESLSLTHFSGKESTMPQANQDRVKQLASRYEEVHKHLKKLAPDANASDSEFFKIIHRPGYTTPADIEIAVGLLDAMEQQAKAAEMLNQTLLNGARAGLSKSASA